MNAVLQTIWNIGPLKRSVDEFIQLKLSEKDMTSEQRLLGEIQQLFMLAQKENTMLKEDMEKNKLSEVEI